MRDEARTPQPRTAAHGRACPSWLWANCPAATHNLRTADQWRQLASKPPYRYAEKQTCCLWFLVSPDTRKVRFMFIVSFYFVDINQVRKDPPLNSLLLQRQIYPQQKGQFLDFRWKCAKHLQTGGPLLRWRGVSGLGGTSCPVHEEGRVEREVRGVGGVCSSPAENLHGHHLLTS